MQNGKFFRKSAFISGLTVADITLAVGILVAGLLRYKYADENQTILPVHPSFCLLHFTTLLVIGAQLPAIIILLTSCERVLAVVFFSWYHNNWRNKKAWYLLGFGYLYCIVSVSVCGAVVFQFPPTANATIICSTAVALGPVYSIYQFYLAAVFGVFSAIATLFSMIAFMKKRKNLNNNANDNMKRFIKKEWYITTVTTVVAFLDLALVIFPNVLAGMASIASSLQTIAIYSYCMFCLRSCSKLFVYLQFNSQFRSIFFHCGKFETGSYVEIYPIQAHPQ